METFNTGAPIVFHTAPPQPASNARCTCMPVLLGGAEASQNGFGERMPAKLILRSAIGHQPFMNGPSGQLSVLHRHHGGSRAPCTNAIPPGINARPIGFEVCVDLDKSLLGLELAERSQGGLLLPNGLHNLV